jgi:hypothetical protein
MRKTIIILIFVVLMAVLAAPVPGHSAGWGWKRATDPDDVINFLNSKPPYKQKITEAEITAVNKGTYLDFIVFYRTAGLVKPTAGGWGWKKATDPDDVKNFLSGQGAYTQPVKVAKIAAVWEGTYTEYYVFYKR